MNCYICTEIVSTMDRLPTESLQLGKSCKARLDELHELTRNHKNKDGSKVARAFQKLKLNWNYHSNAIEGNKLTYGETVALLMHGVTAKGKSLKDHLDVRGHNEAINYMLELINNKRELNHNDIRELHKIILKEPYYVDAITDSGKKSRRLIEIGNYKSMPNHVKTKTGEIHYYVEPDMVHKEMSNLLDWYNKYSKNLHVLVRAAIFHHRFVAIHPFDDGNGRLGRILMNFILIHNGYPPAVISTDDRDNYYGKLSLADAGSYDGIIEYICNSVVESLNLQLAVFENREDDKLSDIDKEIALFKASLKPTERGEIVVTFEEKERIVNEFILPLARKIDSRFNEIAELYKKPKKLYSFRNPQTTGKNVEHNVKDYEKLLSETILNGHRNFSSFHFSYLLDSYKLGSDDVKQSFNLYFNLEKYLFIMNSKGVSSSYDFDFVSDYYDKLYYDKINDIAKRVIGEFMVFTKRIVKK